MRMQYCYSKTFNYENETYSILEKILFSTSCHEEPFFGNSNLKVLNVKICIKFLSAKIVILLELWITEANEIVFYIL